MKAITIMQPWASLLIDGAKRFETRSWSTKYRGPLLIHSSATMQAIAIRLCHEPPFYETLTKAGHHVATDSDIMTPETDLPLGSVLGVVHLIDCIPVEEIHERTGARPIAEELTFGDFRPGRYAWEIGVLRRFDQPIPFRGALGLWEFPDELIKEHYPWPPPNTSSSSTPSNDSPAPPKRKSKATASPTPSNPSPPA